MELCFYCEKQKATTIKLGEASCGECKKYTLTSTSQKMNERDQAQHTKLVMNLFEEED